MVEEHFPVIVIMNDEYKFSANDNICKEQQKVEKTFLQSKICEQEIETLKILLHYVRLNFVSSSLKKQ